MHDTKVTVHVIKVIKHDTKVTVHVTNVTVH